MIIMDIAKISPGFSGQQKTPATSRMGGSSGSQSFGEFLSESINDVDQVHKAADKMINNLASGEKVDIHNTMIAVEKADISFQLMMQIRNKLIAAYQEVYRMQV
jgi:flagellar hook-basal body complex protein FliE